MRVTWFLLLSNFKNRGGGNKKIDIVRLFIGIKVLFNTKSKNNKEKTMFNSRLSLMLAVIALTFFISAPAFADELQLVYASDGDGNPCDSTEQTGCNGVGETWTRSDCPSGKLADLENAINKGLQITIKRYYWDGSDCKKFQSVTNNNYGTTTLGSTWVVPDTVVVGVGVIQNDLDQNGNIQLSRKRFKTDGEVSTHYESEDPSTRNFCMEWYAR